VSTHQVECNDSADISAKTWCMTLPAVKSKPAKHITLPFAVKLLTGNVELVHILSWLGHGVSYSQVEEIDTALCLQKLAQSGHVAVPRNIHHLSLRQHRPLRGDGQWRRYIPQS